MTVTKEDLNKAVDRIVSHKGVTRDDITGMYIGLGSITVLLCVIAVQLVNISKALNGGG